MSAIPACSRESMRPCVLPHAQTGFLWRTEEVQVRQQILKRERTILADLGPLDNMLEGINMAYMLLSLECAWIVLLIFFSWLLLF